MPRLVRLVHPLSSLGDSGDGCSTLVLQQPPNCTSIATPVRSILHQLHVHIACLLETGALGGGEGRRSVLLCSITAFVLLSTAQILLPIPPVQPPTNTGAKEGARRWRWSRPVSSPQTRTWPTAFDHINLKQRTSCMYRKAPFGAAFTTRTPMSCRTVINHVVPKPL
jgi:hypothetical protein